MRRCNAEHGLVWQVTENAARQFEELWSQASPLSPEDVAAELVDTWAFQDELESPRRALQHLRGAAAPMVPRATMPVALTCCFLRDSAVYLRILLEVFGSNAPPPIGAAWRCKARRRRAWGPCRL